MKRSIPFSVFLCVLIAVFVLSGFAPKSAEAATTAYHGSLTYGNTDSTNAYDDYSLAMKAGDSVSITMLCDAANFDPLFAIYDPAGVLIDGNDDSYPGGPEDPCNYSSYLLFTAPADGNYVVRAWSFDAFNNLVNRGFGTGGYTIIVDGTFFGFGPTANNVPNLGLVKIDTGHVQPAYDAPAGGVLRGTDGAEVQLPADADHSGYDTYVVTDAVEIDGEIWIAIWVGGADYGWLRLSDVTPITPLAIE